MKQAGLTVVAGGEAGQHREELEADRLRAASTSAEPGPPAGCSWHDREEEEDEEGDAE